jgi:hypothetical protein|tara:strand:+ start:5771 stop:6001 length:231 start_codon:yes stop_codon:yes gene_type:complete
MIKNKNDIIKSLSKMQPADREDLKYAVDSLQKMINSSKVSEESIKEMYNITSLLLGLQNRFVFYNIMWLKQGFMED